MTKMNEQMAMELLGLNPADDEETIREHIDSILFELKKDILSKYVVPSLLRKKEAQLEDLIAAEATILKLPNEESTARVPERWETLPQDRIEFLEQYEQHISALKLELMQCTSLFAVKSVMYRIILSQEYYMALFKMLFNEYAEALPEEVKSREIIDTGKLLQALKTNQVDNKIVWAIEREITRIDRITRLSA